MTLPLEAGAVDIDAAVVVEVAGRHAHAVAPDVDAARVGDVGEVQRACAVGVDDQVVAKQAIAELADRRVDGVVERLAAPSICPWTT